MTTKSKSLLIKAISAALAIMTVIPFILTGCKTENGGNAGTTAQSTSSDGTTTSAQSTSSDSTTTSAPEKKTYTPGVADVTLDEDECWELALQINNNTDGERTKIKSECYPVFIPDGSDPDGWFYNHYCEMAKYKDYYLLMWSSARRHEDDEGMRVMMTYSKDLKTWAEPFALFDSVTYSDPKLAFLGVGFMEFDGVCYAYAQSLRVTHRPTAEEDPATIEFNEFHYKTSTDGVNWSEIKSLGTNSNTSNLYVGEYLRSGRLLTFGRGALASYTDNFTSRTGKGVGWKTARFQTADAYERGSGSLIETSFIQLKNGVVVMFFRSNHKKLWACMSCDEGASWSKIYQTNFKDGISRFRFGNLPDGRYFCVSNPDYDDAFTRNPLVLSISDDGINFSKQYVIRDEKNYEMQVEGFQKPGDYAYPDVLVDGDDLIIAYSKKKEAIEVTKISISDIK